MTILIYAVALIITITGCVLYNTYARNEDYIYVAIGSLDGWKIKKHTILFGLLIVLPTILLVALRYGIGGDYFNYEYFYKDYVSVGTSQFEPFTELLMSISNSLFHSYQCFLAFVATITYVSFFIWIIKHSDETSLILSVCIFLCFYFAHSMNTIVQILAASIAIWAYDAIQDKKIIPFIILVGVAALFHSSAIVLLPMYFVRREKKGYDSEANSKSIFKIFAIILAFAVFAYMYLILAARYGWPYSGYIGKQSEGGYINVYIRLGFLFYIPEFYFMPQLLRDNEKYELAYIMILIEMVAFTLSMFVAYAFRVAYYFSFAHCIIIPAVIEKGFGKESTVAIKMYFILALLFYFFFTVFVCKYNNVFEYRSILA